MRRGPARPRRAAGVARPVPRSRLRQAASCRAPCCTGFDGLTTWNVAVDPLSCLWNFISTPMPGGAEEGQLASSRAGCGDGPCDRLGDGAFEVIGPVAVEPSVDRDVEDAVATVCVISIRYLSERPVRPCATIAAGERRCQSPRAASRLTIILVFRERQKGIAAGRLAAHDARGQLRRLAPAVVVVARDGRPPRRRAPGCSGTRRPACARAAPPARCSETPTPSGCPESGRSRRCRSRRARAPHRRPRRPNWRRPL